MIENGLPAGIYLICQPAKKDEPLYCNSNIDNFVVIKGVIFVRSGFYEGGIFNFQITIPIDYPR